MNKLFITKQEELKELSFGDKTSSCFMVCTALSASPLAWGCLGELDT